MDRGKKILFSSGTYTYLRDKMLRSDQYTKGEVEVKYFPDGERYQRILTDIDGKDVVLLGGTVSDTDTLEIYDLACGIAKHGAHSLTLVIPYFGYSTMERSVKKGEVVTAKTRARIFSVIPQTTAGNCVILLDLHSEGIPHYFEGDIKTRHIYGKPVIINAARELSGGDFVVACTDAGRAKWVESLANDLHVNAAFVFKRRISGEETAVTSISADVKGKVVIIYDDMIRTGGSLIHAGEAYKNAGASQIYAVTTHGLFSGKAIEKLRSAGIFEKVVSTDSHPNAEKLQDDFFMVKSISDLLNQTLLQL